MKVLVTGGLGHVGSALIRVAPSWRWEITVLDDLSTNRYCSLFGLPAPVRFVEGDIRTYPLAELIRQGECDLVVHLAALTDAASSMGRGDEYWSVNADAVHKVAWECMVAGVPLLYPSTTSVYGPQTGTVDETLDRALYVPGSPYATSKLAGEDTLRAMLGLQKVILRFGTIYGISPGWRNHTAANRFCWQAAHEQPLTVYSGAWEQRRPYLALADALRAIRWAVEGERWHSEAPRWNVVSGNHTVQEVVEAIRLWVPLAQVTEVDSPLLNQVGYDVSADTIRRAGFTFQGELEAGIEETLRALMPGLTRMADAA